MKVKGNPWNGPHRPGAGRSPFAIAAAGGAGEWAHPEEDPMHGKAATRRQRVRRTLARVFAGWRTGLSEPVLVYMSLYGLSFTVGVALGPAVGGALLATSPDAVWWGGALAAALTGAGLLRLGDRLTDPLLQAQCPPPQAVTVADPS